MEIDEILEGSRKSAELNENEEKQNEEYKKKNRKYDQKKRHEQQSNIGNENELKVRENDGKQYEMYDEKENYRKYEMSERGKKEPSKEQKQIEFLENNCTELKMYLERNPKGYDYEEYYERLKEELRSKRTGIPPAKSNAGVTLKNY
eukprot:Nk52_evm1s1628 gene=Nk52_evmTU1s1628